MYLHSLIPSQTICKLVITLTVSDAECRFLPECLERWVLSNPQEGALFSKLLKPTGFAIVNAARLVNIVDALFRQGEKREAAAKTMVESALSSIWLDTVGEANFKQMRSSGFGA